jgi:hypothetical protein
VFVLFPIFFFLLSAYEANHVEKTRDSKTITMPRGWIIVGQPEENFENTCSLT